MTADTLKPGYIVAVTLKPGAAPLRAYVGEVQVIDERGLRISLVDWLIGSFTGFDLFVPWDEVTSALVSTPDHEASLFRDEASAWQARMNGAGEDVPR